MASNMQSTEPEMFTDQALFDDIGARYQDAFGYHVPAHIRALNRFLSDLSPNSRVLDIGCGTGKPTCEMLVQAGHSVTGVDIAPNMVATAQKQIPTGKFSVADSKTFQPKEENLPYDAVTAFFSHLIGMKQADIRAFFPRAYSWIKPGGILVFGTVPVNKESSHVRWLEREFFGSSLDTEQVLEAVKAAGFEVEHYEVEAFRPRGEEAGLCDDAEVKPEDHVFVHARKPADGR